MKVAWSLQYFARYIHFPDCTYPRGVFLRLRVPGTRRTALARRSRTSTQWAAKSEACCVRDLEDRFRGFQSHLSEVLSVIYGLGPSAADERLVVCDGALILKSGKRAYAASNFYGGPWYSNVIVSEETDEDGAGTFARLALLFEIRGISFAVCRYFREMEELADFCDADPRLPHPIWKKYAKCMKLPRALEQSADPLSPYWEILPTATIIRPILLLPIPTSRELRIADHCDY